MSGTGNVGSAQVGEGGPDAAAGYGKAVQLADCGCRIASCAIISLMVVLLVLRHSPWSTCLPEQLAAGSLFGKYVLPVLSSAAVGYLTNAIAIWMLFKPYEKHWFWPQGVIPGRKESFARELGILIPKHLLKPEKISNAVGRIALEYLRDPAFEEKVRSFVNRQLVNHNAEVAALAAPFVRDFVSRMVRETMTPENFCRFCRFATRQFLSDDDARRKTVDGAIVLFKELLPELSDELKKIVSEKVADSFRRKHPILNWCRETFTSSSVEDEVENFWNDGERELLTSLEQAETQEKIAGYLSRALEMGRDWAERPENAPKIESFLRDKRVSAEEYASAVLAGKLPDLADEILRSELFWTLLREKGLPLLQIYVVKTLRDESSGLLAKVDLPGKIRNEVNGMKMEELHRFVVQASNDNLTILQIFGFFLGAVAGAILAFAG